MTRKEFLLGSIAAAVSPAWSAPRSRMGIATTSFTNLRPRDTYEFLERSLALGAGGIQANLTSNDPAYVKKLRSRAEETGMYIEVMIGMPQGDSSQFESTVKAAVEVGALCVRANCLPGRRYEQFNNLPDWQRAITGAMENIDRALAIVAKHRIPLALENHKDFTAGEMAALMKDKSSEYLGVCLDTGNNISLLDDPMDLVETLAPYAVSTHIKDMAVEKYPDGFLLSEMALGEGFLNMKQIVSTIQRARPKTKMSLEMITRSPLQIPCLTEKYWATFPDRSGTYLARALRMVEVNGSKRPLPRMEQFDRSAQLRLEEDNVKQSLNYGREQLGL